MKHAAIALAMLLAAGCAPIFSARRYHTARQFHGDPFV